MLCCQVCRLSTSNYDIIGKKCLAIYLMLIPSESMPALFFHPGNFRGAGRDIRTTFRWKLCPEACILIAQRRKSFDVPDFLTNYAYSLTKSTCWNLQKWGRNVLISSAHLQKPWFAAGRKETRYRVEEVQKLPRYSSMLSSRIFIHHEKDRNFNYHFTTFTSYIKFICYLYIPDSTTMVMNSNF